MYALARPKSSSNLGLVSGGGPLLDGDAPDSPRFPPPTLADLRSDTVTLPTDAMRSAMASAVCGDDVMEDDPTVKELEAKARPLPQSPCAHPWPCSDTQQVAALVGKEAGLYVPSGTMSNLIAVCVWCEVRGSEFIVGSQSHIHLYEQGGVSSLGGVHPRAVPNQPDGTLKLDDIEHCIRADDIHFATMKLVCLETTQNKQGGLVLSREYIAEVGKLCTEHGLVLHIDGARICNAAAALGISVSELCVPADSVSVCLSKGLGAPVGSVLVGPHDFIRKARRLRKALGGGMRQAGLLAAAGLVALRDILPKLGEDHTKMAALAAALAQVPGIGLRDGPPPTNICFFTLDPAIEFSRLQRGLRARGIAINGADGLFRLVMHHQVAEASIPAIAAAFAELVAPMMAAK